MTMPAMTSPGERLITFEVHGTVYALPIAEVLEVAEPGQVTCIPTLAQSAFGVMNWHGDALPVVSPRLLFGYDTDSVDDNTVDGLVTEHVLVVADRPDEPAQMGLPIDRVLGLVEGSHRPRHGGQLVVERRPIDGRVVSVLDPRRLVARAVEVIESTAV